MKKYINLILKDLTVYKNIFILVFAFIFYMNFLVFLVYPMNNLISFLELSILETSTFFVLYKLEQQKNSGDAFLLTTSYTRCDIVKSRFIITALLFLIEFIFYLSGLILSQSCNFKLEYIFCELFLSFLYISIAIPLSFKKSIRWLMIGTICVIGLYFNLKQFINLYISNLALLYEIITIAALIFLLGIFSLKLSNKIFNSQDI